MRGTAWRWTALHATVVAAFLVAVARYYHPGTGFTSMIQFPADGHDSYELPLVRDTPHFLVKKGGYDGQFYAQLAVDPLVKDPAIDRAMDNAPYRARRILFAWTAYALGLGRPAWILQAYALQNVLAWLALAWLLQRWFPVGTPRAFVLWSSCLLTHGLLISVRAALLDGPSLLLLTIAIAAAEQGRRWTSAAVIGISGLARETNLIGALSLVRGMDRSWRSWVRAGLMVMVCALPLLVWLDYLRSIYFSAALGGVEQFAAPAESLRWKAALTIGQIRAGGWAWPTFVNTIVIVAFLVQAGFVVWRAAVRRGAGSRWLPVAIAYVVLGLVTSHSVWEGTPGPITRVVLPLTIGFNVLAREAPWPVILIGNLGVLPGVLEFLAPV